MLHWDVIAADRLALATQLEDLTPKQWSSQSLCGNWTVREVAAHLLVPHITGLSQFMWLLLRSRGNFDRANEARTAEIATRSTTELIETLRNHAESRARPPGFSSAAPLTEILVHGADIRIPLGLDGEPDANQWRSSLEFLVRPIAAKGFGSTARRGVHLIATDCDWSFGTGDEVRGPASALALAVLGRTVRAGQLSGAGVARLVSMADV